MLSILTSPDVTDGCVYFLLWVSNTNTFNAIKKLSYENKCVLTCILKGGSRKLEATVDETDIPMATPPNKKPEKP